MISKKNGTMKWMVVKSHAPTDEKLISKGYRFNGLKGFSIAVLSHHKKGMSLMPR